MQDLESQLKVTEMVSFENSQLACLADYLLEVIVAFGLEVDFSFLDPNMNRRPSKAVEARYRRYQHSFCTDVLTILKILEVIHVYSKVVHLQVKVIHALLRSREKEKRVYQHYPLPQPPPPPPP